MKNRRLLILFAGLLPLAMAACSGKPAPESAPRPGSGSSWTSAAGIGTAVSAIVELSDLYRAPETYDVKITLLEVLRGERSMDLLKNATASNGAPREDLEYVLARVRFEFAARGAPGNKTWELEGKQFSAFSGDGKPYENPSAVPPEPLLRGVLRSGNSQEGWLVFAVAREDTKPVMAFSPAGIWFQLF